MKLATMRDAALPRACHGADGSIVVDGGQIRAPAVRRDMTARSARAIVGSGPTFGEGADSYASRAGVREVETRLHGRALTPLKSFFDQVRLEVAGAERPSPFGAIDRRIVRHEAV